MSISKNEAIFLTITSVLFMVFGFQTEGLFSYIMCCLGSFMLGVTLMSDQASAYDEIPDNLKD